MRLYFIIILFTICSIGDNQCFAQSDGTILVIVNAESTLILDGTEQGTIGANKPHKISTNAGEHYLQVISNNHEKNEIVKVESGIQKILKFDFSQPNITNSQNIANINFAIPGALTVATWMNENPGKEYTDYPTFYYAFDQGDEITLNLTMSNKKGTNVIEIATYPSNVIKYTNRAFTELVDHKIKITERGIYKLTVATNHLFERNGLLKISRRPSSTGTLNFNTNVIKKTILKPIVINDPQLYYVNSGSNATLQTGKSRIIVPIKLPPNTIEWYYRFSASRNPEQVENVKKNFGLFSELTGLIVKVSTGFIAGKATTIAVDQLTQPPGTDFCDIFLLQYEHINRFETKQDELWRYIIQGSRQNFKSGNVKVDCCNSGQYYLGIRNPDSFYGVNVSLEITAITVYEDYVMEQL